MTPFGYRVLGFGSGGVGSIDQDIPISGSETVFESAGVMNTVVAFDPNTANKFVVAYGDKGNSTYGTAVVGTVSGSTISFGTPVVFESYAIRAGYYSIQIAMDPNTANKFVITYSANNPDADLYSVVGTISGTSVSFGTTAEIAGDEKAGHIGLAFDPNTADKCAVVWRDDANSDYGTCRIGTVSGTSITWDSPVVYESGDSKFNTIAFDPNTANKFVVAYRDTGNSEYGTAIVGTISGTTPSFGTAVVFESATSNYISIDSDPSTANLFVIAYSDDGNSDYGTAIVGTVSGTSISFGTPVVYESAEVIDQSIKFDPSKANQCVVTYRDNGNSNHGTAVVGTVSGTSLSFGSPIDVQNGKSNYNWLAFDPNTNGKFVIVYEDGDNSDYGTAILGQTATTN